MIELFKMAYNMTRYNAIHTTRYMDEPDMTRDEFGEILDKIIYWVKNKGKLSPKFDSKVVYGMKEWYDETEYFRKPPAPSLKQQKAAYNIYTKFKIKEWEERK